MRLRCGNDLVALRNCAPIEGTLLTGVRNVFLTICISFIAGIPSVAIAGQRGCCLRCVQRTDGCKGKTRFFFIRLCTHSKPS